MHIHSSLFVTTLAAVGAASASAYQMAEKGAYTLFDAPISTEAPPSTLFPANGALKTWLAPRFLAQGAVGSTAIPTNSWWGNIIAASGDADVTSVWSNPYALRPLIKSAPFGLSVNYPYPNRNFAGSTGHGNAYYYSTIATDFVISAAEFTAAPTFQVTSWDDLSATLSFSKSTTSKLVATLVPGMAFTTTTYTGLTPQVVATRAIASINAASGTRFVITLDNGQKWVLYAGSSITLTLSGTKTLTASGGYTGYLRLALVVSDAQLAALDKSASCLLEGSNIEAKDATSYMFHLKTSGDCSNGLFHYLQVHHMDTLDTSSATVVSSSTAYSATRGPMTGVLTTSNPPVIKFSETQSVPVSFYPSRSPRADIIVNQKIKTYLVSDINANWNVGLGGSYYFNGKAVHKYANLCLMANDAAISGSDKATLTRQCLNKLESVLAPMLDNSWTYRLNYDTTYRGIISPLGIIQNDVNADFGNTMYNDHHYHYGYWIAASAIVNYLDPAWPGLAQLNRVTKFLIRDVANPTRSDTSFPKFRQFDWFRGHSYSHGATAVTDGKDEESTSEDINFHYALALYGKATNDSAMANIGQLMLKLNTRSVQNYFLMESTNRVHPPSFVSNKVTGILWENKVAYETWFSTDAYAIHGIQMIPITPVTEFVRTVNFVAEEWDSILSKIPDVVNNNLGNAWLSLLYANYATVNMKLALEKLQSVNLDDGLTRSWALYMAASSASTITPPVTTPTPVPTTSTPVPTSPSTCGVSAGGQCGSDATGVSCCPSGQYCQPWNPSYYQCIAAPSQCGTQEVNVDYYGSDIKTIEGILPGECCSTCASTDGCVAYTFVNYNSNGKSACYLKSGLGTKKAAVGVVSSTVINPKAKCTYSSGVDFYGNDLSSATMETATQCCDKCASTSGCAAFTFVNSVCYMKTIAAGPTALVGAVSGVVN